MHCALNDGSAQDGACEIRWQCRCLVLSRVLMNVAWMLHSRQRPRSAQSYCSNTPRYPCGRPATRGLSPGLELRSWRGFVYNDLATLLSVGQHGKQARALRGFDEGNDEHILHYKPAGSPRMAPAREATRAYVHGGARDLSARVRRVVL